MAEASPILETITQQEHAVITAADLLTAPHPEATSGTTVTIPTEEYLAMKREIEGLNGVLATNAEFHLYQAIQDPVLLPSRTPTEGHPNPRKVVYELYQRAKGHTERFPNVDGKKPNEKRGLLIYVVDPAKAKHNFFPNQQASLDGKLTYTDPGFSDMIERSRKGDCAIVIDGTTGNVLMEKGIFQGFNGDYLQLEGFHDKANTRTLNAILGSHFGAAVLVTNTTGEVAALEAGNLMKVTYDPNNRKQQIPLYCNVNKVPEKEQIIPTLLKQYHEATS